jgi:hypothetical protein
MSDLKVVNSAVVSPQRSARDAALNGVLNPAGVLPDLLRLIRGYDLLTPHRWQVVADRHASTSFVSSDGRVFTVPTAMDDTAYQPTAVSTCTLVEGKGDAAGGGCAVGPLSWRVHVPAGVQCWPGLVDIRTLGKAAEPETVYLTGFTQSQLAAGVWHTVASVDHDSPRFVRNPETDAVVRFQFDPTAGTLSAELTEGDRVHAMRTIVLKLRDGLFLAPHVIVQQRSAREGSGPVTVTIDCDDQ